ncbi:LCP family protein [Streptomyces sp. bgisy100]|uniref:LCP family protein n=1 Tax=Streptomyces sp. bgisy100 TaxID=3413783 RepID=UPI003D705F28
MNDWPDNWTDETRSGGFTEPAHVTGQLWRQDGYAPEYGAVPEYGTGPHYAAAPDYAMGPDYGTPGYAAAPDYGAASDYGVPDYGTAPGYGTGPAYGAAPHPGVPGDPLLPGQVTPAAAYGDHPVPTPGGDLPHAQGGHLLPPQGDPLPHTAQQAPLTPQQDPPLHAQETSTLPAVGGEALLPAQDELPRAAVRRTPPARFGGDRSAADGDGPGRRGSAGSGAKRPRRRKRMLLILAAALLLSPGGAYAWGEGKLNHDVDLDKYGSRPAAGKGTNYLIVGSDSRDGLTAQAKKDLHTGTGEGRRTDSMMVLHTSPKGRTTMVSLPRDSWVTLPGFVRPETGKHLRPAKNKLNAAFSLGGPELLVRTIENNTGLRIDHYAEIGFAGFVNIVDAVGGVNVCLDRAIKDEKSGADLKKGCQTLHGTEALAFVRQRHQEAEGDLGRAKNQQKFLAALAKKAGNTETMLDPPKLYDAMDAGLGTLIVDKDTRLWNLTAIFKGLKSVSGGQGTKINVPVSNTNLRTSKGSAVEWDEAKANQLFAELRNDRRVTVTDK